MHSVQPPAMQVSPQVIGLPWYRFTSHVKVNSSASELVCQIHESLSEIAGLNG